MLVQWLQEHNVKAIAYTYNEPLVAFEYVLDCAKAVHEAGFYNVLVSAGYVNPKPLAKLLPFLDGANIDLKTMNAEAYRYNCDVELNPVLTTLKTIAKSPCILEVTNLVIPDFNDTEKDFEQWCNFVCNELGKDIPVHFSRFFPLYKMKDKPVTPLTTLSLANKIAKAKGLKYVYLGNIPQAEITYCPECNAELIIRDGFATKTNKLINNHCPNCGSTIYGRF